MIGHDTLLIEAGGQRIVTDPYLGTWGNLAYARVAAPAKTREELRDATLVLVSHNHWDHTDYAFLRMLGITPRSPLLRTGQSVAPYTIGHDPCLCAAGKSLYQAGCSAHESCDRIRQSES